MIYQIQLKAYITTSENDFISNSTFFILNQNERTNSTTQNSSSYIIGGFKWKHPYNYYTGYERNIYSVDEFEYLWESQNGILKFSVNATELLSELREVKGIKNVFIYYDASYSTEGVYLTDLKYFGIISENQLLVPFDAIYINRVAVGGMDQRVLYWLNN